MMTMPPVVDASGASARPPVDPRVFTKRAMQMVVQTVTLFVALVAVSGNLRWWNAWFFLGVSLAAMTGSGLYVFPRNPEIIVERGQRHQGTKRFDFLILSAYAVAYCALLVVAALDAGRFGWAPLSPGWSLMGGVALLVSMVPIAGAMAANRNLEPTVRIQADRGHQVATTGPYRWVRHPMYTGMILQLPAAVLILGSTWAFLPTLVCVGLIIVRTVFEDRTLRRELPGYAAYAATTRYRIVPKIW
jgi:protein-S-isoprenylcysteine O-methyltransferase Ste14